MDELDVRFENNDDTWIDVPEDLIQRMFDLARSVAWGHDPDLLRPEAVSITVAVDNLLAGVVSFEHDEGEESD